jgi:hypothetical protein
MSKTKTIQLTDDQIQLIWNALFTVYNDDMKTLNKMKCRYSNKMYASVREEIEQYNTLASLLYSDNNVT